MRVPWDEERGPAVILADGTQTIFTADMSGDGLTDIVRVRNGEVCYWPSTGYGRFGAKVTMDGAPRFDSDDLFDPRRVRLADIDGTGTADLLYVGADGVTAWFNQSGNGWSSPTLVAVYPAADELSTRPGDRLPRHRNGLPGLVLAAARPRRPPRCGTWT